VLKISLRSAILCTYLRVTLDLEVDLEIDRVDKDRWDRDRLGTPDEEACPV
jgi:hypothetical protein